MNHAQQQTTAATNGHEVGVGSGDGFGEISRERKVVIALCALCLLLFAGSVIAIAFMTDIRLGLVALALIAWWLGSSLAGVLKESRKGSPPNPADEPRAENTTDTKSP